MYRPGDGGGGETPPSPPPPQYTRHAISGEGLVEKSVSTGTTAMTGVVGGRSGSSRCRLPCTSNATGTSWSAIAVATSTLASPVQRRRCSGTGRDISSGRARAGSRARSAGPAAGGRRPLRRGVPPPPPPPGEGPAARRVLPRGRHRNRAGCPRRDLCRRTGRMLQLLLLLAAGGAEGVWPPSGPRPSGDSGEHRDSVPPVTTRAGPLRPVMPALWSNDYGGVTLGVRARPMRTPDTERGLFVASAATRGDATSSVSLYGRWHNPFVLGPGVATSVAMWSVEGRSGAAVTVDRAARRPGHVGADRHEGITALWMATTNLGYLDRRLWDDAGSLEIGPWISTAVRHGETVLRARGAVSLGLF